MPTSKKPRKPKTASVAAKRKPDAVTMLPDRRAMEGVLAMLSSGLGAVVQEAMLWRTLRISCTGPGKPPTSGSGSPWRRRP